MQRELQPGKGRELAIPEGIPSNSQYSREQVLRIMEIYTEVVYTAGQIRGIGSELDDPSARWLGRLTKIKAKMDGLPPEIRRRFPEPFDGIEEGIAYCRHDYERCINIGFTKELAEKITRVNIPRRRVVRKKQSSG